MSELLSKQTGDKIEEQIDDKVKFLKDEIAKLKIQIDKANAETTAEIAELKKSMKTLVQQLQSVVERKDGMSDSADNSVDSAPSPRLFPDEDKSQLRMWTRSELQVVATKSSHILKDLAAGGKLDTTDCVKHVFNMLNAMGAELGQYKSKDKALVTIADFCAV